MLTVGDTEKQHSMNSRLSQHTLRASLVSASLGALAWFGSANLEAQQKNQIRMPRSQDLRLTINQADRSFAEGKYGLALELYLDVLEKDQIGKDANRVFELNPAQEEAPRRRLYAAFKPRYFIGVSDHIRNKLKAMPASVLKIYRERFDYKAEALYQAALKAKSEQKLEQFYRNYAMSSFGAKALRRLADIALERGSLGRAGRRCARLLKDHKQDLSDKDRFAIRRQYLFCLVGQGEVERVRAELQKQGLKASDNRVAYGDETLTEDEVVERAARIRRDISLLNSKTLTQINGSSTHESSHKAALWIGKLCVKSVNFARIRRRYTSPRRYRSYPPQRGYSSTPKARLSNSTAPIVIQSLRRQKEGQKVLEPIALLSTGSQLSTVWLKDGKPGPRVYLPSTRDHGESGDKVMHGGSFSRGVFVTSYVDRVNMAEDYRGIPIKVNIPVRKLCAIDTKRWRTIWNHQQVLKGTPYANASFPAPPVIVEDTVYAAACIIEGFVHSYVMAFDLWTGKLKWATWLCSGQVEQTMFGEHAREPLATCVAVRGDRVYHSSSLGVVAALDARSGQPKWMSTYEQTEIRPPRGYYADLRPVEWANNPPIVTGKTLIATPLDSKFALAYDLKTGKRLWRVKRENGIGLGKRYFKYLVGAENGQVIFTGSKSICSYGVESGRLLWEQRDNNVLIKGRGLIANGQVCIPVSTTGRGQTQQIHHFSLSAGGKVVRRQKTNGSDGGDLALVDDRVLIVGRGTITGYENREPRRTRDF